MTLEVVNYRQLHQHVLQYGATVQQAAETYLNSPPPEEARMVQSLRRLDINSFYEGMPKYFNGLNLHSSSRRQKIIKDYKKEAKPRPPEEVPSGVTRTLVQPQNIGETFSDFLAIHEETAQSTLENLKRRYSNRSVPRLLSRLAIVYKDTQHTTLDKAARRIVNIPAYTNPSIDEIPGITYVYRMQRKPYTEEEIIGAKQLAIKFPSLLKAVILYSAILTNYAKLHIEENPKRTKESYRHFNTLFYFVSDIEATTNNLIPDLNFLNTFISNIFPAIERVRKMNKRDYLEPDDIKQGILLARQLRQFRRFVPLLKYNEQTDKVNWQGNFYSICPAESMVTNTASLIIPELYALYEK